LRVEPHVLEYSGAAPGENTFTVTNQGNADLNIQKVTPAPDAFGFTVSGTPPTTLAPGQSLAVHVKYNPDGKRKQAFGGIQVWSNDERYPTLADEPNTHVAGVEARAGNSWLLTAMIFVPLLGALLILLLPAGIERLYKWVALLT